MSLSTILILFMALSLLALLILTFYAGYLCGQIKATKDSLRQLAKK